MNKLEIYPPAKQGDKPCIRDNRLNQFGERDEIQAIIDKLRADVAQRDERIVKLKKEVNGLCEDTLSFPVYPEVSDEKL